MIQNASITSAHIQDGTITNAKMGTASIGTLNVAGGAVTSMAYGSGSGSIPAGGSAVIANAYLNMPAGSSGVVVTGTAVVTSGGNASAWMRLRRNGITLAFTWMSIDGGRWSTMAVTGFDSSPPAGTLTYELLMESPTSGPGSNMVIDTQYASITATGGKR